MTFFVRENGCGKSTLLEAVAKACGFNGEGGSRHFNFSTRSDDSLPASALRVARSPSRPRDGYFLRAETFFNVASNIELLDSEEGGGAPIIDAYGGKPLHAQSHGESFLALFMNRFRGCGLYILDEPEAALSPMRQLAMLGRMRQLVDAGCQFVIATHSPILMAYPQALIYQISENGIEKLAYQETDHYQVSRGFLNNPQGIIGELFSQLAT